jgi:hypothetical protein
MSQYSDYLKYIKYKTKYEQLKQLIGGALDENTLSLIDTMKREIDIKYFKGTEEQSSDYKTLGELIQIVIKKMLVDEKKDKIKLEFNGSINFRSNVKDKTLLIKLGKIEDFTKGQIAKYGENKIDLIFGNFGNDKIIEFKLLGLINRILNEQNEEKKYSSVILLEKLFLDINGKQLKNIHKNELTFINPEFISFISFAISYFKGNKRYFDIEKIYNQYQNILFNPSYDSFLHKQNQKMFEHQIKLLDSVYEFLNDTKNKTVIYKPIMGTGKTFSFSLLLYLFAKLRSLNRSLNNVKLVFCCDQIHVLNEIYNLANHLDSGNVASIIVKKSKLDVKILDGKRIENINNIICDTSAYIYLLDKDVITDKTILFFDEPTINSAKLFDDNTNNLPNDEYLQNVSNEINIHMIKKLNKQLARNVKVITSIPKFKILSSATLSDVDTLKQLINGYSNDEVIEEISSNEVKIATTVKTLDGKFIYMPHMGCQNVEELKKIVGRIKNNLLLKKMYSFEAVRKLYDDLIRNGVILRNDLIFGNKMKNNVDTTFVIDYGLELLDALIITNDDTQIANVCSLNLPTTESVDVTKSVVPYVQNLIVTKNPTHFVDNNDFFKDVIKKTKYMQFEEVILNHQLFTKEWCKGMKLKYDRYRIPYNDTDINKINSIRGNIKYINMLLSGIGIYCKSEELDDKYLSVVSELASSGKLAFLISDSSISYGTNYSISVINIDKDVTKTETINTIFQLFNRAGRIGKSWFANIYIENNFINRLSRVLSNDILYNKYDIETRNFLKMYKITKDTPAFVYYRIIEDKNETNKKPILYNNNNNMT